MTAVAALHPTPIGDLLLLAERDALVSIRMDASLPPGTLRDDDDPLLRHVGERLDGYFAGEPADFDLPVRTSGTPFQERVWSALRDIPYGATISYRELAERIGAPKAARAVGVATGRNPVPLILPCHRVIGSDGSLTGYGWGTGRKRFLLELEAGLPGPPRVRMPERG